MSSIKDIFRRALLLNITNRVWGVVATRVGRLEDVYCCKCFIELTMIWWLQIIFIGTRVTRIKDYMIWFNWFYLQLSSFGIIMLVCLVVVALGWFLADWFCLLVVLALGYEWFYVLAQLGILAVGMRKFWDIWDTLQNFVNWIL